MHQNANALQSLPRSAVRHPRWIVFEACECTRERDIFECLRNYHTRNPILQNYEYGTMTTFNSKIETRKKLEQNTLFSDGKKIKYILVQRVTL